MIRLRAWLIYPVSVLAKRSESRKPQTWESTPISQEIRTDHSTCSPLARRLWSTRYMLEFTTQTRSRRLAVLGILPWTSRWDTWYVQEFFSSLFFLSSDILLVTLLVWTLQFIGMWFVWFLYCWVLKLLGQLLFLLASPTAIHSDICHAVADKFSQQIYARFDSWY